MLAVSIVLINMGWVQAIPPPAGFKVGSPSTDETYIESAFCYIFLKDGVVTAKSGRQVELEERSESKVRRTSPKPILIDHGQGFFKQHITPGNGTPFMDGELFTADVGEWGGALVFLKHGSRSPVVVLKQNIKAIGIDGRKLYALTGISHMSIERTAIYEVIPTDKWNVREIAKPSFVPPLATWSKGRFIIGGSGNPDSVSYSTKKIYELALDGKAKEIAEFDGVNHRTTNILEAGDGTIWLSGMHFVAAVRPGGKPTFFVPLTGSKPKKGKGRTD